MAATLYEVWASVLRDNQTFYLPRKHLRLEQRGDHIATAYHATDIVKAFPDGHVVLSNGGYQTKSTREFMDMNLPSGWRLIQQRRKWYVFSSDGTRFNYQNGMNLWPDVEGADRVVYPADEPCEVPADTYDIHVVSGGEIRVKRWMCIGLMDDKWVEFLPGTEKWHPWFDKDKHIRVDAMAADALAADALEAFNVRPEDKAILDRLAQEVANDYVVSREVNKGASEEV